MERRSFIGIMAAAAAAATLPIGCTRSTGENAGQTNSHLVVYLWQDSLLGDLASHIKSQLPDADIEFIVGNNGVDLYCYLQEHGQLPDIITTRRFSAGDANGLQPYLMDFSAYDVVSQYSPTALQYFKNVDGEIQWLPVCGIPETTIVNKTLLDGLGLSVPESYDEFAQLCASLAGQGVKPYVCELSADWACHSLLQGAAIDQFESIDGIEWRNQAESTQGGIAFDGALWTRIFEEVDAFIGDVGLAAEDVACELPEARNAFIEGRAAMFRGTPEVMEYLESQMPDAELVRLPYFSQTSDEGWAYTYASLNVAFNKDLASNKEKLDCALAVLDCMISEEGQRAIAGGAGMISYNVNVPSSLDDGDMSGIKQEMSNNQFYIRYASNNSFPASLHAVQALVGKTASVSEVLETFEDEINAASTDDEAITFEATYGIALNDAGGRDAASSILASVRNHLGFDLAFTPYSSYTSSIYQGPCTKTQLRMLTAQNNDTALLKADMPGSAVKELVSEYLAHGSGDFDIDSSYVLPIASGMKLEIAQSESGFSLQGIQVDGKPIDDGHSYSVLLAKDASKVLEAVDPAVSAEKIDGVTLSKAWLQAVADGQQPAVPEDYIALARA